MKMLMMVMLSLVSETLSQASSSAAKGQKEAQLDACLGDAANKASSFESQADQFCGAKLKLSDKQLEEMRHKTGKTCEAKFEKDDSKGVDRDCNEYPAFCSQIKIPKDVSDALMKVPVFAVKPCVYSKLIDFKKKLPTTPLKCTIDIIVSLYMS